jgi:hypothetical protein
MKHVNIDKPIKILSIIFVLAMIALGISVLSTSKQGFKNSESSNNSMFLFANNKSDPSCCNFSYSSTNGCVCIDKEQQMLLHTRGGNRTIDADF